MKSLLSIFWRRTTTSAREACSGLSQFWFRPAEPNTLALVRILTGISMLCLYASCLSEVLSYIGPDAWVDQSAVQQIREQSAQLGVASHGWSVWFHIGDPTLALAVFAGFIGSIVLFTLGLFSRTMNVVVWLGHLSFVHRSAVVSYGVDYILAMLLMYQLIGPSGARLSVDALLTRYRRRKTDADERRTTSASWNANFALRCIQVHMCLIYLCAGLAKLQGDSWWSGYAIWEVLIAPETTLFDMRWLARLGDGMLQLICGVGVALTLGFEISFAFLIWNRRLRPVLLLMALVLHGCIGVLMGLGAFSLVMLTGCCAFVDVAQARRYLQTSLREFKRQEFACGYQTPASEVAGT
jgi:hypothetical protein